MKIVFASSRTASNKRKICQQKIDFDINASTNKLQLLSGNILITLKDGFVCHFYNFGVLIRVRYCDYSTWESDRVASLSCLSVHPFPLSFYQSITALCLLACDLRTSNFIQGKTDRSKDFVTMRQNWYLWGNSQEQDFLLHTDDSMVKKNAQNHKVLEW